MDLNFDELVLGLGGEVLIKGSNTNFNNICTDTRKIEKNNVFNDIFLLMEDLNLAVKKFLIRSEKNNEFFVELSFEKADKIDDFRIFDIISKNLDLFFDNSIENQGVKNVNVKGNLSENKENKKNEKNEIKKEKLGEVTDKSGRKTVFYKNQNGRIIQQVENE